MTEWFWPKYKYRRSHKKKGELNGIKMCSSCLSFVLRWSQKVCVCVGNSWCEKDRSLSRREKDGCLCQCLEPHGVDPWVGQPSAKLYRHLVTNQWICHGSAAPIHISWLPTCFPILPKQLLKIWTKSCHFHLQNPVRTPTAYNHKSKPLPVSDLC